MFKKILLPTDGSRHSEEAARIAAELSARHEGVVHPLVAVEYGYLTSGDLEAHVAESIRTRIQGRAQKALDETHAAIQAAGGKSDGGRIAEGTAPEAILHEAEDGEYDLIVLGSRGVSIDNGHDRLLGSVAERVLHRAPCPVLVIRAEPTTKL